MPCRVSDALLQSQTHRQALRLCSTTCLLSLSVVLAQHALPSRCLKNHKDTCSTGVSTGLELLTITEQSAKSPSSALHPGSLQSH